MGVGAGPEPGAQREGPWWVPCTPRPPLPPRLNSPTLTYTQVFYESANGVLLSEGFDGVIPPRFFSGAEDRRTGKALSLDADGDAGGVDGVRGGSGTSTT